MCFRLDQKYCGPPRSGNGGYVCGLCAEQHSLARNQGTVTDGVPFAFEVKYRRPLPIGAEARFVVDGESAAIVGAEVTFAHGSAVAAAPLAMPVIPSFDEALRAAAAYPSADEHLFPDCFVCGPNRDSGDGLRIFTGRLNPSASVVAAPWKLHPSFLDARGEIPIPIIWAALDCPGYFAYHFQAENRNVPTVLAKMKCTIFDRRVAGAELVVLGWLTKLKLPLFVAATALFDGTRLLAQAEASWMQPKDWSESNVGGRA